MRVIRNRDTAGERVVALGTFDGVHRGHRALLKMARAEADARGCPLRVYTFDRHPLEVIAPDHAPELLTTLPEKAAKLARLGVDEMQVIHFDRNVAAMDPEAFLAMLRQDMIVLAVAAGWNYTFGRKAAGTAETLLRDGERCGYDVLIEDAVMRKGQAVSSSRVRDALKQGDAETAEDLLYAPYSLGGTVTRDGNADGYRTAVFRPAAKKVLPGPGIYECLLLIPGGYIRAAAGFDPDGRREVKILPSEVCPDLTGKKARLELLRRQS